MDNPILDAYMKDHLIKVLCSSQKIKKIETLKNYQKGDFARHCPKYYIFALYKKGLWTKLTTQSQ